MAALSSPAAGLCLNCWSLQELVSRDAGNYLILVEKILGKAKEVSWGLPGGGRGLRCFEVVSALGLAPSGVLQSLVGDFGLW